MKKEIFKRVSAGTLAGVLALGTVIVPTTGAYAATEHWNDASAAWTAWKDSWKESSSDYEHISLTPGVDETQMNLAWYSHTAEEPVVKVSKSADMSNAVEFKGSQTVVDVPEMEGYYSNKVTAVGIEENTTYYYQVFKNGDWSEINKYDAKSFSNYSILYVGDPQIGACKNQTSADEGVKLTEAEDNLAARNDAFNWNNVLNQAVNNHDVSFMVSAGDQVNTANNEIEYAGYLGADALTSLPVATSIGNHDSKSIQYTYHFNNPNVFTADQTDYSTGATVAGTDYYYTYGDVLFIVLDTNNYNCATHKNVIAKAVSENPDAKWRVVTFHQDIYGSGLDHSDSDGIVLRTQLTPIFDEFNIDVVLQGHDHTYSRSYQLTGDGKNHTAFDNTADITADEFKNENNCYNIVNQTASGTVVDPEGTVYFEANSSTGSKFYNLITTQQDYISERSQTWTPSYSVINVSENALSVTTYDATTGLELEGSSTYTIVKEADKEALKKNSESVQAVMDEADKYTEGSVTSLKTALDNAQAVIENVNAKTKEVNEAIAELSKASAEMILKAEQTISVEADNYIKAEDAKVFNIKAENSGEGKLLYKSSDINVATVDADGNVSINGSGKAVITITAAQTKDENEGIKEVTVRVVPNKVTVSTVKSTKTKKVAVKWNKVSGADGYEIKYSTDKSMKKSVKKLNVKGNSASAKTISKLSKGKKYYITVTAYTNIDGKKCYGKESAVKAVICK